MKKDDLLLIIDMQNVYDRGGKWECLDTRGAARNLLKIIDCGMENVIFTRFIADEISPKGVWADYNKKYSDVNSDTYANQMLREFNEPLKKFPLYTKSVYSSLAIPQVLEACRKTAQKGGRVVVGGVVAECCVLSTVLALIDEGIYTIYLTDAVSGLDSPKEKAVELTFSGLSPLHLKMLTTSQYMEEAL
ncbi:cysteine hydrolase family protein [uncultured Treponema sp.]|uniref:cysteine hydrolase family protein n=1 Tax=uncultured Treponema sp. TaxID=162155 RepID=UPI0015C10AFA|nr:isochorismatase family protein [uncultured Treponema sp.]